MIRYVRVPYVTADGIREVLYVVPGVNEVAVSSSDQAAPRFTVAVADQAASEIVATGLVALFRYAADCRRSEDEIGCLL